MVYSKNEKLEQFCLNPKVKALKLLIKEHKFKDYASRVMEFCEFTGKTPEQLLEINKQDKLSENPLGIMEKTVYEYYDWLQGKEVKGKEPRDKPIIKNSAITYAFGYIGSFFKANRNSIEYIKKFPKRERKSTDKVWFIKTDNGKEAISTKDLKYWLKKIVDNLTIRDKAISLCESSSGLYSTDLMNLTIKDFNDGNVFKETGCTYIQGTRDKTQEHFTTAFSKEATETVKVYLEFREKREKELNPNGWLFVSNQIRNGNYEQLQPDNFARAMKKATKLLKLSNITPKSHRDYFETLVNGKITEAMFNIMVGYKGTTRTKDYQINLGNPEEFLKWYSKEVEPIVMLGNGNGFKTKVSSEISELRQQIHDIKESNEQLLINLKEMFGNLGLSKEQIKKAFEVLLETQ